jgi:hypothetical protein
MNASYTKLNALRRRGIATALISVALLAVSAPATLNAGGASTPLACQPSFCGG